MPAIWRNPSSHWRRGPRRSNRCRTARSGPQLGQGVSRGRYGRVAAQKQERRPDQQASDATGSGRRRRRGPAPADRGAGTGERGDAGGGGGSQKKTRMPTCGACRTGERTLPVDRLRPTCSLSSMTCLPGIAPSGHLLPPCQARG